MNIKRFVMATIAGFAFVFLYEFLVHGHLLAPIYEETIDLWRSKESMEEFMPWMTGTQFLFVAILSFIYTRHHESKGLEEGVRFGVMFGLLFAVMAFAPYAWLPISMTLAVAWAATTFVEVLLLGIILSAIYKK